MRGWDPPLSLLRPRHSAHVLACEASVLTKYNQIYPDCGDISSKSSILQPGRPSPHNLCVRNFLCHINSHNDSFFSLDFTENIFVSLKIYSLSSCLFYKRASKIPAHIWNICRCSQRIFASWMSPAPGLMNSVCGWWRGSAAAEAPRPCDLVIGGGETLEAGTLYCIVLYCTVLYW